MQVLNPNPCRSPAQYLTDFQYADDLAIVLQLTCITDVEFLLHAPKTWDFIVGSTTVTLSRYSYSRLTHIAPQLLPLTLVGSHA